MKRNFNIVFLVLVIAGNFLSTNFASGIGIQEIERIKTPNQGEAIRMPWSFCVSDNMFIIPDQAAGNIKLIEQAGSNLEFVKTIGRKGYAIGEMVEPAYCFYNERESKFAVWDVGKKKILVYGMQQRKNLYYKHEIYCPSFVYDIGMDSNKIFISGFVSDNVGGDYDLYYIDIENGEKTYLLPSYLKYGMASKSDYDKNYLKRIDLRAIGAKGFFDVDSQGKYAYFVWEGSVKIYKIDIESKKIATFYEAESTGSYTKPKATASLIDNYRNRNFGPLEEEKAKLCLIRKIYVSSRHALVIYEGPDRSGKTHFSVIFFDLNGKFIKDVPIPGPFDRFRMWFDKDRGLLYSLCRDTVNNSYFISKYEIQ